MNIYDEILEGDKLGLIWESMTTEKETLEENSDGYYLYKSNRSGGTLQEAIDELESIIYDFDLKLKKQAPYFDERMIRTMDNFKDLLKELKGDL